MNKKRNKKRNIPTYIILEKKLEFFKIIKKNSQYHDLMLEFLF